MFFPPKLNCSACSVANFAAVMFVACVFVCVCLSVYLFVCLFICLFVYLFFGLRYYRSLSSSFVLLYFVKLFNKFRESIAYFHFHFILWLSRQGAVILYIVWWYGFEVTYYTCAFSLSFKIFFEFCTIFILARSRTSSTN